MEWWIRNKRSQEWNKSHELNELVERNMHIRFPQRIQNAKILMMAHVVLMWKSCVPACLPLGRLPGSFPRGELHMLTDTTESSGGCKAMPLSRYIHLFWYHQHRGCICINPCCSKLTYFSLRKRSFWEENQNKTEKHYFSTAKMLHFRFPDLFFKITLPPILFQKLLCVSLTSQFRERKSQDIKKKKGWTWDKWGKNPSSLGKKSDHTENASL